MNRWQIRFHSGHVVIATILLGACGIDQGGVQDSPGSAQAVVFSGPITGFGSVEMNGVSIETGTAQIFIDGNPGIESDLQIGQIIYAVAEVEGSTTSAVLIEYQENVSGPIDTLDAAAGTLTVLGQQMMTDAQTQFDILQGSSLADLSPGNSVVISGFQTPSGIALVTFIGSVDVTEPFEVTATIDAVDLAGQTFTLGNLIVDYAQANQIELPNGMPEAGIVVEVEGSSLSAGVLVAQQIRELPSLPGLFSVVDTEADSQVMAAIATPGTTTQLSANVIGFVTDVNSPASITLGDVLVLIDTGTVVTGGILNDIQPGHRVQVAGEIPLVGTIQASTITIF